jgi:hypothetical protein
MNCMKWKMTKTPARNAWTMSNFGGWSVTSKKWMATTKPNANQEANVGFFQVWSSKVTNEPSHDIMRRTKVQTTQWLIGPKMCSSKAASAGMTTDNGGGDKVIARSDIGLVKGTTMPSFKKGMTLLVIKEEAVVVKISNTKATTLAGITTHSSRKQQLQ